jgi:hypothetical protein
MSLALHPTHPLALLWAARPDSVKLTPPTCVECGYPTIDEWCSWCDLERIGALA